MSEEAKLWDIIIVGGGPAGVAAAIYTGRSLLKTVVIEKAIMGGNVVNTERIENYPGFHGGIEAFELAAKFRDHAAEFGAEIKNEEVQGITLEGNLKIIETNQGSCRGKAVIIATGLIPTKLGASGEDKFWGRGVSACATCDGPFYKDLVVAVVGGGNAAVEEAIHLTKFAKEVHIVHRRDQLRAIKLLQERAFAEPKIKYQWNSVVKEIYGSDVVEGIELEDVRTHETRKLAVDGTFIYVGLKPISDWVGQMVQRNKQGYILVDKDMQTNVPGIFAAGDVVNPDYRQVVISAGEGARAALAVEKYLTEHWSS